MICFEKSFEPCIVLREGLYILNEFKRIDSLVLSLCQETAVKPIFWLLCLFYPSLNFFTALLSLNDKQLEASF